MTMTEPHIVSVLSDQLSKQTLEDIHVASDATSSPNLYFQLPESTSTATNTSTSTSIHSTNKSSPRNITQDTFSLQDGASSGMSTRATRRSQFTHAENTFKTTPRSRHKSMETGVSVCIHNNKPTNCQQCLALGSPPAPPMKKHCRSLSIPGDGGRWRPRASTVWKPPLSTHCDLQRSDLQRSSQSDCSYTSGATKSQQGSHAPSSGILFKFAQNSKDVTGSTVVQFQSHTLSKSDEFMSSTPPESPSVTRPASASSGFFDSTSSSLSLTGDRMAPSGAVGLEPFRTRSYSFESPVFTKDLKGAQGSLPVISICDQPSSPSRLPVPRCQSQPSIFSEQRKIISSCLKRRRGEDRPALDFFKMNETALGRKHTSQQPQRGSRSYLTGPPESIIGLNTIASSPLDSNLPLNFPSDRHTVPHIVQPDDEADATPPEGTRVCEDSSPPEHTTGRDSSSSETNGDNNGIMTRSRAARYHTVENKEDEMFDIDIDQMEND